MDLCSFTPSSFVYDLTYIFAYFAIRGSSDTYISPTFLMYFKLKDETTGETLKQQSVIIGGTGSDSFTPRSSSSVTLIWAGKRDPTHTYKVQVYVDDSYDTGDSVWINGYVVAISGHDHGTHIHNPEPGIYETPNYPSDVEVYLYNSSNPSGIKVADKNTHSELAGGNEFSVTKIDITDYVDAGENTIEVRSSALGTIAVDGFYRVFIETSK